MWHHIHNYNINQRGTHTIHDFSTTKYQKVISILILKHENVLAEVIESNDVHLYRIIIYNKLTVLKYT